MARFIHRGHKRLHFDGDLIAGDKVNGPFLAFWWLRVSDRDKRRANSAVVRSVAWGLVQMEERGWLSGMKLRQRKRIAEEIRRLRFDKDALLSAHRQRFLWSDPGGDEEYGEFDAAFFYNACRAGLALLHSLRSSRNAAASERAKSRLVSRLRGRLPRQKVRGHLAPGWGQKGVRI